MSDKDDKKREIERQRERDMDAEIFGKTMGFVYSKHSQDFKDATALEHAHAPGLNKEEEYQATVRFSSSQAMMESDHGIGKKPVAPQKPAAPAKPAAPQAPKAAAPQKPAAPAKPAAPQAAKPTPPQPAKPAAAPQAPKAAAPQKPAAPAKPAAPQAAKPTPPQPAKPAAAAKEPSLDGTLSLDELEEFLLPDAETPEKKPAAAAETTAAAETDTMGLGNLDWETSSAITGMATPAPGDKASDDLGDLSDLADLDLLADEPTPEVNEFLIEDEDKTGGSGKKEDVSAAELDLLAELDELDKETAGLVEKPAAKSPVQAEADSMLAGLDLDTGDLTASQVGSLDAYERETETSDKVVLTEKDELPEGADLDEDEFLLVEEPARSVSEEGLASEPPFEAQYDEDESELDREFVTTSPDVLTETSDKPAVDGKAEKPAKPRGSGFAVFLALLGIAAAGGVGWQTMQNMDRLDRLEARINTLQGAARPDRANARQDQAIATLSSQSSDLGQRLDDLERAVTDLSTRKQSKPAASVGSKGDWVVNLTSVASEAAARKEIQRLKGLGIEAESSHVEINGKVWYRIRVGGFADAESARAKRDELASKLGIKDSWIGHR